MTPQPTTYAEFLRRRHQRRPRRAGHHEFYEVAAGDLPPRGICLCAWCWRHRASELWRHARILWILARIAWLHADTHILNLAGCACFALVVWPNPVAVAGIALFMAAAAKSARRAIRSGMQ